MVREAAALLLAGESCKAIARALNDAGHTTSTGRPWRDVTVRDMLIRERNAGLRVHHGAVFGPGKWQPIMDEAEYLQVKTILSDPSRRTTPGRDGRVHLLSVLARCGVCHGPIVVGRSRPYKGKTKPVYRCRIGHVIRDQAAVDDLVTRVILARLGMPDARDLLTEPGRADEGRVAAAEAERLRERLTEAAEAYAAGVLTLAQLMTINASVRPSWPRPRRRRRRRTGPGYWAPWLGSGTPARCWAGLSPERRRAVVALLVEVEIMPTHSGPRFDPSAVEITWRTA